MCLAYPMKVVSIDGAYGVVEAQGVKRRVGLTLLPDAQVGDDVLVHAGYAISRMEPAEADETRKLFDDLWTVEKNQTEGGKTG